MTKRFRHIVQIDQEELEKLLNLPSGLRLEVVRLPDDRYSAPGLLLVISGPGMAECPARSALMVEQWDHFSAEISERNRVARQSVADAL